MAEGMPTPSEQSQFHAADDVSPRIGDFETLRRKLLDLTTRNRLLHYSHPRRTSLRVIDELPTFLCERLLAGQQLNFVPVPQPTKKQLIDSGYIEIDARTGDESNVKPFPRAVEWAKRLGLNTDYELPQPNKRLKDARHFDDKIQTPLYPEELEGQLRSIYGAANLAINETGANILYLALGFLEWYESDDSDIARLAPLILIPVEIERGKLDKKSGIYLYSIKPFEDEFLPNLSLREKLRVDFGLALPEIDPDKSVEDYFKAGRSLIEKQKPRWKVHRYATVGLFNFAKLLLYLDLDPKKWPKGDGNIINHPVIRRFVASSSDESPAAAFALEYDIDGTPEIHKRYPVIYDADSSQHSALIDAIDGRDLVIEGPPGTGKSQTITNLIAAALSNQKTVLFVAEKLAALEVVKHRLDQAELGEFCLELHSNKAKKKAVLEELGVQIENRHKRANTFHVEAEIARYEKLRGQLSEYAQAINQPWKKTSRSIQFILSRASKNALLLSTNQLHPCQPNVSGETFTLEEASALTDRFAQYVGAARKVTGSSDQPPAIAQHPWYGVESSKLTFMDRERVVTSLSACHRDIIDLEAAFHSASSIYQLGANEQTTFEDVRAFHRYASKIFEYRNSPNLAYLAILNSDDGTSLDRLIHSLIQVSQSRTALKEKFNEDVLRDEEVANSVKEALLKLDEYGGPELNRTTIDRAAARVSDAIEGHSELGEILGILNDIHSQKLDVPALLTESSASSIASFIEFADFAAQLPARMAKHRGIDFDSFDFDNDIAACRSSCETTLTLVKQSRIEIDLENPPDLDELKNAHLALKDNSVLRLVKRRWWRARKLFKARLRHDAPGDINLEEAGKTAIDALEALRRLENNQTWRESFGALFRGIHTPISDIESLAAWVRSIRKRYGFGFGKEVVVGDALLRVPESTIVALASLKERGVLQRAGQALARISTLRAIFPRLPLFQGERAGCLEAAVPSELGALIDATNLIGQHTCDTESTVGSIREQMEVLDQLFREIHLVQQLNERIRMPEDSDWAIRFHDPTSRSSPI